MPAPHAIPPYIVEASDQGRSTLCYVRPPHRMDRLMRFAMRFTGIGQLALATLLLIAASRLTGADAAIAVAFAVVFIVGGVLTLWWMARTGGVSRVEIGPEVVVLQRAGFGGLQRRISISRAAFDGLRAEAIGEARGARWRLWLRGDRPIELATIARTADDLRPARRFAEALGVPLQDRAD